MNLARNVVISTWLWFVGLVGVALPLIWWPRRIDIVTVLYLAVVLSALAGVIFNTGKDRFFDGKRSPVWGLAGVGAYVAVLVGGVFVYRLLILGHNS